MTWEVKKLKDIGKIYNGNSINEKIKKDKYTSNDEGLPFIATKDVSYENIIDYDNGIKIPFEEKDQFKVAPKNTILICAEGGSAGRKIGFTNQDICFGNKLFACNTDKNIDSRYVYYYYFSSSFQKQFSLSLTGLIGGVSMNKFREIEIPIPALIVQKHIVKILDNVFENIVKAKDNAEKNLNNATEIFESYLQRIFENKGEGWEETKLEKVLAAQPKNGWSPPLAHHSDSGTPVLTLSSVTGFKFKSNKIKFTSAPVDNLGNYWVKNGDLLITRSNTSELVGHVAIVSGITNSTIYPDLIMRINPAPTKLITKFLYYQLRSPILRREIISRAHGANPTMKKISKSDVQNLPIVITSLKQQQYIVSKLDSLSLITNHLESIYEQKLSDLEELKKSILQKAFNGELIEEVSA